MTVIRVVNATYQWGGDADLLREVAVGADVLLIVEARDRLNQPVPVATILGPEWDVQQDTTSGAKAGTAIAVRRDPRVVLRWSLTRLLSRRGRNVQDRYLRSSAIRVDGKVRRVAVVHLPLASTGRQQDALAAADRWVEKQRRRHKVWLLAGDFNMAAEEARSDLDAPHCYGAHPMGLVWSHGWGDVQTSAKDYQHADHAVLTFTTKEKP